MIFTKVRGGSQARAPFVWGNKYLSILPERLQINGSSVASCALAEDDTYYCVTFALY